jgi:hypothetical protein
MGDKDLLSTDLTDALDDLVERCASVLDCYPLEVQAGALAELLALHVIGTDDHRREALLADHCDCVRALIPYYEKLMLELEPRH